MKNIFLLFLCCCLFFKGLAQAPSSQNGNRFTDSLKNQLTKTTKPAERFNLLNQITFYENGFLGDKVDSANSLEMLQIAEQLDEDSMLAISYNWIGSYLASGKGDNASGLEYFFKALPHAEKTRDKRRISSLYFDIAICYFNLQNNEEALKNIRKGGANLPDPSSPMHDYMLVQYQRGMTRYFLAVKQPDSALKYSSAMAETSRRVRSKLFEFGALYLNGSAYAQLGDVKMANVYFKKANAYSDSIGHNLTKQTFYNHYIPFLLSHGMIVEARDQARKVWELGLHNNNNLLLQTGAAFLRQAFDSLHQNDSAYHYARMESELNARIFSQDNINKVQALAFNEQLREIEDEARAADEAEARKNNIQYALIAIGIIVLFMLYLLLSRSFITNTRLIEFFGVVALLIVFEFLNLLLHPFLVRITHHSPILMLLSLVGIASLLVPLHHKIEKWTTARLVEKNKQIRLAAAKKTIEQLEGKKKNST
ncbi:MAG: hypothetical protein IPI66_03465 [Chitinophagaceae bacterium]|nr:hypothetical protein [Chitinophagaceae bacterium]